jgi:hypothetical protein
MSSDPSRVSRLLVLIYLTRVECCEWQWNGFRPYLQPPDAGQGLLSKRFSVAKNSADGGLGGCAREFAIRINRSNSARSVAA